MDMKKRYTDFPAYISGKLGCRVQKLSIDAGFTCPNRDGTKGYGGCSFCNNESFIPVYCRSYASISEQLRAGKEFFEHKYKSQAYLAYFQSYSNTYAPFERLRKAYEEALRYPGICGLVIGTRPDTVDGRILDYLEYLARSCYVCVEYGVESMKDEVLVRINRGHNVEDSLKAIEMTAGRGIDIAAHIICGLPGESEEETLVGVEALSVLPVNILKLHQLQIIKDTPMASDYEIHPEDYRLYTLEEYLDTAVSVLERIRGDICVERFVNQAPSEYVVAPLWGIKNFEFTDKLRKRLEERNTWQGRFFIR